MGASVDGAVEMARRLVDFANTQGGRDNITAAVYVHTPVSLLEPQVETIETLSPEPAAIVEEPMQVPVKRSWISFEGLWPLPRFQKGT